MAEQDQNQSIRTAPEEAINTLRKEYRVVSKTRIRPWHAWLIAGFVVGLIAGIVWVANKGFESEASRAAEFGLPPLPPAPGPPKAPPRQ